MVVNIATMLLSTGCHDHVRLVVNGLVEREAVLPRASSRIFDLEVCIALGLVRRETQLGAFKSHRAF